MKPAFESVTIKLKLIRKIIQGQKIKDICNDLEFMQHLRNNTKFYTSKNEYSSYQALYRIYNNFRKDGYKSLINVQGMYKMSNKKTSEENKEKKWEEFIDNLDEKQVRELLKIISKVNRDLPNREQIVSIIDNYRKDKKKNGCSLSIEQLCYVFGIPKASYYRWKMEPKKDRRIRGDKKEILSIIKKEYELSNQTYGINRIWMVLRTNYSIIITRNTVRKYMIELNIASIIRRKSKRREDYKNTRTTIDNILNRNFVVSKNNKSCCTDVTYIKWRNSFIYLSAAISLIDNRIIGFAISLRNNTNLVMKTFADAELDDIKIIHSDHGYQYSSKEFRKFLIKNKIEQSMSRVGNSLDNRPIEYWFSIIKSEKLNLIDLDKYNFDEVNEIIEKFVLYYNNERIQSNLNWMSPNTFRMNSFVS